MAKTDATETATWKSVNLELARRLPEMAASEERAWEVLSGIRHTISQEPDWELRRRYTMGMRSFCRAFENSYGIRGRGDDGMSEPLEEMFPPLRGKPPEPEDDCPFDAD